MSEIPSLEQMLKLWSKKDSCNMKCFDGNYKYDRCLLYEHGVWVEYKVKSWSDYDDGTITVWTRDGQMIFTHTTNVIMYGED